ncbi:UNVERIFIED_CONTAM: hypothetical protein FKN15_010794 [Acipenser sinensis]
MFSFCIEPVRATDATSLVGDRLLFQGTRVKYGEDTFNRAKLLNIGYTEVLKDAEYDCFIFSDVDLIPMDDRNLYHCYDQPRHFAIAMDKFGFRLPYAGYFGGVSGLTRVQFLKINGFPNEYWGWGGEDDDIYNRITLNGMKVSRPDVRIGRYRMIKHERDKHNEPNPQRDDFYWLSGDQFNTRRLIGHENTSPPSESTLLKTAYFLASRAAVGWVVADMDTSWGQRGAFGSSAGRSFDSALTLGTVIGVQKVPLAYIIDTAIGLTGVHLPRHGKTGGALQAQR